MHQQLEIIRFLAAAQSHDVGALILLGQAAGSDGHHFIANLELWTLNNHLTYGLELLLCRTGGAQFFLDLGGALGNTGDGAFPQAGSAGVFEHGVQALPGHAQVLSGIPDRPALGAQALSQEPAFSRALQGGLDGRGWRCHGASRFRRSAAWSMWVWSLSTQGAKSRLNREDVRRRIT